jgi:hypothetical protein
MWDARLVPVYAAATRFAPLIVRSLLTNVETLALLRERAAIIAPDMHPSGRDTRLAWHLADAVAAADAARDRAWSDVLHELRPLLQRRAPSAALLAAARRVNATRANILWRSEIETAVDDAIADELRRRAHAARRARIPLRVSQPAPHGSR